REALGRRLTLRAEPLQLSQRLALPAKNSDIGGGLHDQRAPFGARGEQSPSVLQRCARKQDVIVVVAHREPSQHEALARIDRFAVATALRDQEATPPIEREGTTAIYGLDEVWRERQGEFRAPRGGGVQHRVGGEP